MDKYNPREIEAKWQQHWQDIGLLRAHEGSDPSKKSYILVHTSTWSHSFWPPFLIHGSLAQSIFIFHIDRNG